MDLAHDILPCALPDQARDATPPEFGGALLESRQRWRDFALLAADLAFETDAEGRWTFLSPAVVLGWACGTLLGQPARDLLLHPEPDPFRPRAPARGLRAWLRQASGAPACLSISVAPLIDAEGRLAGLRGIARDVTAEAEEAEAQAAALRRAQALESLVRRVRRQALASRMLTTTLESLMPALGCAGAAVIEISPCGTPQAIYRHGADPGSLLDTIRPLAGARRPGYPKGPAGERMALLPHPQDRVPHQALLAWRTADGRPFDADDRHLLTSAADLLFVALGNQALQRELEMQARTDGLTGLLNRRAFLDDLHRRLDRQSMEPPHIAGAVLFIDLDNFKPLNDRMGHEAGDAALVAVAGLLRDMVRPTDLVARFGGDEFAVWLQDADAEAAAMRAGAICRTGVVMLPALLPGCTLPLTFSIGGAVRLPDGSDTPASLLARADGAMYEAKRAGRNGWRLALPPDHPPIPRG